MYKLKQDSFHDIWSFKRLHTIRLYQYKIYSNIKTSIHISSLTNFFKNLKI